MLLTSSVRHSHTPPPPLGGRAPRAVLGSYCDDDICSEDCLFSRYDFYDCLSTQRPLNTYYAYGAWLDKPGTAIARRPRREFAAPGRQIAAQKACALSGVHALGLVV